MGGGKNAASREASRARREEERRQREIRQGTSEIDRIFEQFGPTFEAQGQLGEGATFDPNATYYTQDGSEWEMPTGGGSNNNQGGARQDIAREGLSGALGTMLGAFSTMPRDPAASETQAQAVRQRMGTAAQAMRQRMGTAGQDGEQMSPAERAFREAIEAGNLYEGREETDHFDDIQRSYTDFARPQIDDQFGQAQNELTFGLARGGLLDSSVRGDQESRLGRDRDIQLQDMQDQARGYANEARTNIEQARGDLLAQLQATGDAQGTAQAAMNRAAALSEPPSYSPIGQLFTDVSQGLGQQAALERAEFHGNRPRGSMARFNTGLFTPSPGAVRSR